MSDPSPVLTLLLAAGCGPAMEAPDSHLCDGRGDWCRRIATQVWQEVMGNQGEARLSWDGSRSVWWVAQADEWEGAPWRLVGER